MNLTDDLDPRLFDDLNPDDPRQRLSRTEEDHLARTIEAGVLAHALPDSAIDDRERRILIARGEVARQRFVLANLGLVTWVIAREWRGDDRDDLFQEGVLGLDRAVRGYDHRVGGFAAYAVNWIQESVFTARAHRINRGVRWLRDWHRLRGLSDDLGNALGRDVSVGDLAEAVGKDTEWVIDRLRPPEVATADPRVLDRAVENAPDPLGVPAEVVQNMLAELDGLSRRVLQWRFGIGGPTRTRAAIARTLGMTVKQVAHLEAVALDELRGVCPREMGDYLAA